MFNWLAFSLMVYLVLALMVFMSYRKLITKVVNKYAFGNCAGMANPKTILTVLLLSFIGLMFILYVTPLIETEIAGTTITNTLVLSFLDILEWAIPVGGITGIIFLAIKQVRG